MQSIFDEFDELATKYYPGSKKPRGELPKPIEVEEPEKEWHEGLSPMVYQVNGENVEFYTIGALSRALGRKPMTLRAWMREGILPEARFRTPGGKNGSRRLWTRRQIDGLRVIAKQEGILEGKVKNFADTGFTQRVIELMRTVT